MADNVIAAVEVTSPDEGESLHYVRLEPAAKEQLARIEEKLDRLLSLLTEEV